jgi:hypothetical protein
MHVCANDLAALRRAACKEKTKFIAGGVGEQQRAISDEL